MNERSAWMATANFPVLFSAPSSSSARLHSALKTKTPSCWNHRETASRPAELIIIQLLSFSFLLLLSPLLFRSVLFGQRRQGLDDCVRVFVLFVLLFFFGYFMRKEPLMIELPLLSAFKKGRYEIQIWRWHTNELAAIILENIIFSHVLQTCRERESLLPCWRFRVEAPVSTGRQGDFPFWWNQIKRK